MFCEKIKGLAVSVSIISYMWYVPGVKGGFQLAAQGRGFLVYSAASAPSVNVRDLRPLATVVSPA